MKNKAIILTIGVLVAASPFLKIAADANKQPEVTVAEVTRKDLQEHLVSTGKLAYENELNLDAKIAATVQSVLVNEGDEVRAGQTLIRLQSLELDNKMKLLKRQYESLRVEHSIAHNDQAEAKRLHDINLSLIGKSLIGKEEAQKSRQTLENAHLKTKHVKALLAEKQTQIEEVRSQRQYLTIKAPIKGIITRVNASPGENVYPNQMNVEFNFLISMVDDSAIYADVLIDERSLAVVYKGQSAQVTLAPYPDKLITGKVSFIYPTVSQSSQGIRNKVRIRLDPESLEAMNVKQNTSCLVKVLLSEIEDGVIAPMQAIVDKDQKQVVYVYHNQRVARRLIQTGSSDFQQQHILTGLKPGEEVVTGPMEILLNLTDGQAVKVKL
jgi:RND family efflux transporter MFP subunit